MISAILCGSTHLYGTLILPYQTRLYRIAFSHMKNEEDAKDVAQESLLKGFIKLHTFQRRSRFSTWLIGITINEARNRLRRSSSFPMQSLDHSLLDGSTVTRNVSDAGETPAQSLERQELRRTLLRAMEALSEDYRQVFVLRVMQELTTFETAKTLKISIALVKTRLHRARVMLQASLGPGLLRTK
ncbi:RNA polymerase, sigma subunit, SigW [Granulicella pectinivorans]|uniref:RNA polymerase, sigma subunit, SigW n=1 Tax=Granulicella pectinivorans TaxID=474950 RepID=A0A1I6MQD8_9BACT|nr:sigma-70 family RNA polymerase sigma factor [Granulicella pectinivorans]SFS17896.1 RNA polymerase, sigma subunit, SigW [Granulicella pectinivorans]